jgi:hypothetical protein
MSCCAKPSQPELIPKPISQDYDADLIFLFRTSRSDCNTPNFPPLKMAQVYQAIKAYDPFHIVIGAPWAAPWSLYTFGESVGSLGMDYAQVENCERTHT